MHFCKLFDLFKSNLSKVISSTIFGFLSQMSENFSDLFNCFI